MVDTYGEPHPRPQRRMHFAARLETQKVDRRRLLVVRALQIFIGDGVDLVESLDPDPHVVFHAPASRDQSHGALLRPREHRLDFGKSTRNLGRLDHHPQLARDL